MVTLQYALKRGIEAVFQLEESELAGEPLPDRQNRNAVLYYESSEGGAGALTRLAADPTVMRRVAQRALEICHFTSKSGDWRDDDDLENADDDCEAGCYKCLLSYFNQPEHTLLDRRSPKVLNLLCRLVRSDGARGSSTGESSGDAFTGLMNLCTSSLEREWLTTVQTQGFALPDHAQPLLSDFGTQPDFSYDKTKALIYVDGPHHHSKAMKLVDDQKRQSLRDAGYKVIVFTEITTDWPSMFEKFAFVFGKGTST